MNLKICPVLLTLALACGLSACGQKGDLYMPEKGRTADSLPAIEGAAPKQGAESAKPNPSTKEPTQ